MLLRLAGVTGPFQGLCGVYEKISDRKSGQNCFRFLGVFHGFSDWVLYFSNYDNWVVGRQDEMDSGAGWICSEKVDVTDENALNDPSLTSIWKVYDGSTWVEQHTATFAPLPYIPSNGDPSTDTEVAQIKSLYEGSQKELVASETTIMKLQESNSSLSKQLSMQYKRQKNLKKALENADLVAMENSAFGLLDEMKRALERPKHKNQRFSKGLLLNFIESVVEEYVQQKIADSGKQFQNGPMSLAEIEMQSRLEKSQQPHKGKESEQRTHCTRCYRKFSQCTCDRCFECDCIIKNMGRDRHHCRKCGIPLCENDWVKKDESRGRRVCRSNARCENRQYQLKEYAQLSDPLGHDSVSDEAENTRSSQPAASQRRPGATRGRRQTDGQSRVKGEGTASTTHTKETLSGAARVGKKKKKKKSRRKHRRKGESRSPIPLDDMRTELAMAQRLARLKGDDSVKPVELARELVQYGKDRSSDSGSESNSSLD